MVLEFETDDNVEQIVIVERQEVKQILDTEEVLALPASTSLPITIEQWIGLRGLKGETGPANVLNVGSVTQVGSTQAPSVTITGTSPSQTLNFNIPASAKIMNGTAAPAAGTGLQGDWYLNTTNWDFYEKTNSTTWTLRGNIKGPQGIQGPTGPAPNLTGVTVTTGAPGTNASGSIGGTNPNYSLSLTIPRGDVGASNTLAIGTVSTLAPGSTATASITGTSPNQTLSLGIPAGAKILQGTAAPAGGTGVVGDWYINTTSWDMSEKTGASTWTTRLNIRGAVGPANTLTVGTVTTGAAGSNAAVTITGTAPNQTINLTIPRGDQGIQGPANTLAVGTVSKLAPGSTPTVSITGSSPNQTINFGIVTGDKGEIGSQWYTGSGAPAAGTGVIGDFYLVTGATGTGDVYKKTGASTWTLQGNIRGLPGNGDVNSVNSVLPDVNGNVELSSSKIRMDGSTAFGGTTSEWAKIATVTLSGSGSGLSANIGVSSSGSSVGSNAQAAIVMLSARTTDLTTADVVIGVLRLSRFTDAHFKGVINGANGTGPITVDLYVQPVVGNQRFNISQISVSNHGPSPAIQYYQNAAWGALGAGTVVNGAYSAVDGSAITVGTIDIARLPTGTSSSTVALGNHGHALTDANITGIIPDAQLPARLGPVAKTVTDWNSAIEAGFYYANGSALNAPNNPQAMFGTVEVGVVSNDVTQTVSNWAATSTDSRTWRRHRVGGTWGAWYKLSITQAEQDARYAMLTTDQTIGGNKTFSAAITAATAPTAGGHLTNKTYVDGLDAANVKTTGSQSISGAKTFTGSPTFNNGAQTMTLGPGAADHVYLAFAARTAAPSTRTAWIGYGGGGTNQLTIQNEISGGPVHIATVGNGNITLNAGTGIINATTAQLQENGSRVWSAANIPSIATFTTGTINNGQLPARLQESAATITDWNAVTTTGFFMANNAANAPVAGQWLIGYNLRHNDRWNTQEVWQFTHAGARDGTNTVRYRRQSWDNAGTTVWGSWYRVLDSIIEQDARYAMLTGNQTIAGTKTFSSSPIVPTPTAGTQAANMDYVNTRINEIVDAAPGTLDTLNELAAALGDDPNFATTVTNSIAEKVSLATNETITGHKIFQNEVVSDGGNRGFKVQRGSAAGRLVIAEAAGNYAGGSSPNDVIVRADDDSQRLFLGVGGNASELAITNGAVTVNGNLTITGTTSGITAAMVGASPSSHLHDDRYYTETETNTLLNGRALRSSVSTLQQDGWMRIASNAGSRASAEFIVYENGSGRHNWVRFSVSAAYNSQPQLTVWEAKRYGTQVFTDIRVLTATTYDPQYVEIKLANSVTTNSFAVVMLNNEWSAGWTLLDPATLQAEAPPATYAVGRTVQIAEQTISHTAHAYFGGNVIASGNITAARSINATALGEPIVSGKQVGTGYTGAHAVFVSDTDNTNGTQNWAFQARVAGTNTLAIRADGYLTTPQTINAANFTGGGSGLTSLNASNLGSGTVPDARLPNRIRAAVTSSTISDPHTITESGYYYVNNVTTNPPAGANTDYYVHAIMYSSMWGSLRAVDARTSKTWVKYKNNNTWTGWIELHHANNSVDLTSNQTINGSKTFMAPRVGVNGGNAYLDFDDPGTGSGYQGFRFNRATDGAGMRVISAATDDISYEFWMSDNPDSNDRFRWYFQDWQGNGGFWEPLRIQNGHTTFASTQNNFYGRIEQSVNPFYSSSNGINTVFRSVGTGGVTVTPNVSGFTRTGAAWRVYWVRILADGATFEWGSGATSNAAIATGLAMSTSPITLDNGVTITFSAATGGNAGEVYQWRVYSGGQAKFGEVYDNNNRVYSASNVPTIANVSGLQTELDSKVSLSGDQTIAGVKTFTSAPVINVPGAGVNLMTLVHNANAADGLVLRQAASGQESPRIFLMPGTGNGISMRSGASGEFIMGGGANNGTTSGTQILLVTSGGNATFAGTVTAGGTGFSGSGANITGVVHTSGNETIAGTKTFSSEIVGPATGNVLKVGDDARLVDINVQHVMGVVSQTDTGQGGIQFGAAAGNFRISGIGTAGTATGSLNVTGTLSQGGTAVSLSGHLHDDRYYTESESDARFVNLIEVGGGTVRRARGVVKWEESGANLTGSLIIQTNLTFGNFMTRLHIQGYNYATGNENIDLKVGFYAYSTPAFHQYGAQDDGSFPISQVRLMRRTSDSKVAVVIDSGMASGYWQYPKLIVDVITGHAGPTDAMLQGWTVTRATDLSAYTAMTTPTITRSSRLSAANSGYIHASDTFRVGAAGGSAGATGFMKWANSELTLDTWTSSAPVRIGGSEVKIQTEGGTWRGLTAYTLSANRSNGNHLYPDIVGNGTGLVLAQNMTSNATPASYINLTASRVYSYSTAGLGGTAENYTISRQHTHYGSTNNFHHLHMMHRSAAGADWTTSELIDGIGVDVSFMEPSSIRTWWKRNPNTQVQTWGSGSSTAQMTLGAGNLTITGSLTTGGVINQPGTAYLGFDATGVAAPSFTTRSAGTKIVLYPAVAASASDYAIGIDSGTLWNSVPTNTNTQHMKWIFGTTTLMQLTGGAYASLNVNGTITQNGTGVSLSGHTHDDRYYTETEADAKYLIRGTSHTTTTTTEIRRDTTGTDWNSAQFSVSNNTGHPQVSFHHPGIRAYGLRLNRSTAEFEFVNQAGTGYANVRGNLSAGDMTSGTVPQARMVHNVQRFIFTTGSEARPTGSTYVEWVGPVQPTNAIDGDTWVNTA